MKVNGEAQWEVAVENASLAARDVIKENITYF